MRITRTRFVLESKAQKQPPRVVLRRRCSENMQQIYRRTPMPKCDLLCNFIEITLRHGCSPVNLLYIFRTPFLKIASGRLLLKVQSSALWKMPSVGVCHNPVALNVSLICEKCSKTLNSAENINFKGLC